MSIIKLKSTHPFFFSFKRNKNQKTASQREMSKKRIRPYVLNGAGLRYEGVKNSDGLGPVLRATKLGELHSLGDSRSHEFSSAEQASRDQPMANFALAYAVCLHQPAPAFNDLALQIEVWNWMIGAPTVDLYRVGNGKRKKLRLAETALRISIQERCALAFYTCLLHVW